MSRAGQGRPLWLVYRRPEFRLGVHEQALPSGTGASLIGWGGDRRSRIEIVPPPTRRRSLMIRNTIVHERERVQWNSVKKGGTARRDKTLAAPCRFIEILAGKCGFAGQWERRCDRNNGRGNGNANRFLT